MIVLLYRCTYLFAIRLKRYEFEDIGHVANHAHHARQVGSVPNLDFENEHGGFCIALFERDVIDVGFGSSDGGSPRDSLPKTITSPRLYETSV